MNASSTAGAAVAASPLEVERIAAPPALVPYAAARQATALSILALLSPIAGIGVEMALAWRFGASATVDAYRMGALLLVFGQQLLTQQILPNAIVPVFTAYRAQGNEREGWRVALALANLVSLPAAALALFAFLRPEMIVQAMGPGLSGDAREMATLFCRWFLPTYVPLVWCGMAGGLLYAHEIFWLPAAAQLTANMILVGAILAAGRLAGPETLVAGILLSAVASFGLYAMRLLPLLRSAGVRPRFEFGWRHPGVHRAAKFALPMLGTLALAQWAGIIVNRALSELPVGTMAAFGYAWKLGQPVMLLPISLATVLFPRFSRRSQDADASDLRALTTRALRMGLFIAVPLAALFYVARLSVVEALLARGRFSADAAGAVAALFGLLLAGLPAAALVVFLEKVLYAVGRPQVETWAQLASTALLAAAAPWAARRLGGQGVMLLYGAILPWFVAACIGWTLWARHRAIEARGLVSFVFRLVVLAGIATWISGELGTWVRGMRTPGGILAVIVTGAQLLLGAGLFFCAGLALRLPEAKAVRDFFFWQAGSVRNRLLLPRRSQLGSGEQQGMAR